MAVGRGGGGGVGSTSGKGGFSGSRIESKFKVSSSLDDLVALDPSPRDADGCAGKLFPKSVTVNTFLDLARQNTRAFLNLSRFFAAARSSSPDTLQQDK